MRGRNKWDKEWLPRSNECLDIETKEKEAGAQRKKSKGN